MITTHEELHASVSSRGKALRVCDAIEEERKQLAVLGPKNKPQAGAWEQMSDRLLTLKTLVIEMIED